MVFQCSVQCSASLIPLVPFMAPSKSWRCSSQPAASGPWILGRLPWGSLTWSLYPPRLSNQLAHWLTPRKKEVSSTHDGQSRASLLLVRPSLPPTALCALSLFMAPISCPSQAPGLPITVPLALITSSFTPSPGHVCSLLTALVVHDSGVICSLAQFSPSWAQEVKDSHHLWRFHTCSFSVLPHRRTAPGLHPWHGD